MCYNCITSTYSNDSCVYRSGIRVCVCVCACGAIKVVDLGVCHKESAAAAWRGVKKGPKPPKMSRKWEAG